MEGPTSKVGEEPLLLRDDPGEGHGGAQHQQEGL